MTRTLNLSDVIRLLRQGLPYVVIAERLGCHANTVGYHAKKLGIAARRSKR
jgi:DNA-binding CsgD family transcriptional regulator